MSNADLVRIFERIADLLEIDGADRFRINSYRRVARTIKDTPTDVAEMARNGDVTDLQGVGKGTAERIRQVVETDHIDVLVQIEAKFPTDLPALLEITGVGPRRVGLVQRESGLPV